MRLLWQSNNAFIVFAMICYLCSFAVKIEAQDIKKDIPEDLIKEQKREKQPDWFVGTVEVPVNDSLYIVGPNDILTVAIFSTRFYAYDVQVSSDGKILIPLLGELVIKDKSLRAVRAAIRELVSENFKNAQCTVNLARARVVKVTVSGAVSKPGIVLLSATSRVSEAIQQAGGFIKDTTAYRNIFLVRNNSDTIRVDLLRYFRLGDYSKNPFIGSGDIIYVPPIDQQVSVLGAVNHESHIDYVPGEKLFDLIEIAQGFKASAFLDSVQIVRFEPDHVTTKSFFLNLRGYPKDASVNISMQPSDLVLVRSISKYNYQRLVIVQGEVRYPGSYPIEKDRTTLSEIIRRAGGFADDASLEEAIVIRKQGAHEIDREFERLSKIPPADMQTDEYEYLKARSRERIGQMVVDFKRLFLFNDMREDIILREDDVIEIPAKKNYIRIIGRVLNPGNVIFNPNWGFEDYIRFAHGYGWRADEGNVRIIKARTGEFVDADNTKDYILEPGDTIWVPEEPEIKFWNIVLTAIGVISQLAAIVGVIIALASIRN